MNFCGLDGCPLDKSTSMTSWSEVSHLTGSPNNTTASSLGKNSSKEQAGAEKIESSSCQSCKHFWGNLDVNKVWKYVQWLGQAQNFKAMVFSFKKAFLFKNKNWPLLRLWSTASNAGKAWRRSSMVVTFWKPMLVAMSPTGPWPTTRTCFEWNSLNIRRGECAITTWKSSFKNSSKVTIVISIHILKMPWLCFR